jgi:hypothetical protein
MPIPIVYEENSEYKSEQIRHNFWEFLNEYKETCFQKSIFLIFSSTRSVETKVFNSWISSTTESEFSYFKFDLNVPIVRSIQSHEIESNSCITNEIELLNQASIEGQFLWNDITSKHHLLINFLPKLTIKKILYQDPIHLFSRIYQIDFHSEHISLKSFLSFNKKK